MFAHMKQKKFNILIRRVRVASSLYRPRIQGRTAGGVDAKPNQGPRRRADAHSTQQLSFAAVERGRFPGCEVQQRPNADTHLSGVAPAEREGKSSRRPRALG